MALTNLFISPAGAGNNSGDSVANALQAIDSGDWSSEMEALDRADKRFIFLTGTYTHTTKLTFSGSAPTDEAPCQWVGAKSDGTVLRPKFNETGLRLDLTDYPLFVCTANTASVDTEEETWYKCLSFQNTNTDYSQGAVVEPTTGDADQQGWYGCNFKADPGHNNAEIMVVSASSFHMCVFESVSKKFDRVVDIRGNGRLYDCRVIGGGTGVAEGGDGDGITVTTHSSDIRNCVVTNCHGNGIFIASTSAKVGINIAGCTVVNNNTNGIDSSNLNAAGTVIGEFNNGNIIFGNGVVNGHGFKANAADDRIGGMQISAMGGNSAGNFDGLDSYEDMIDVITITSADFIDYANEDYRIHRDSVLYNFNGTHNFGAMQNDDFEFVSVS